MTKRYAAYYQALYLKNINTIDVIQYDVGVKYDNNFQVTNGGTSERFWTTLLSLQINPKRILPEKSLRMKFNAGTILTLYNSLQENFTGRRSYRYVFSQ